MTIKTDQPKATIVIKDQTGTVVFEGKDPGTLSLARKCTYTVDGYVVTFYTRDVTLAKI